MSSKERNTQRYSSSVMILKLAHWIQDPPCTLQESQQIVQNMVKIRSLGQPGSGREENC